MDKHFSIKYRDEILKFPGCSRVSIGQSRGCDVRLPNTSRYEDVVMAKIVPQDGGNGWILVRCSGFYPFFVNGSPLNRVCYLSDGDTFEVLGEVLRFNIEEGAQSEPSVTHVHKAGKVLWGVVAAMIVAIAFVGYSIFDNGRGKITGSMEDEIKSSLFSTRVDSLQLIRGDSIAESYVFAFCPVGTAFLTTDSLIVTARHCIQPWLNMVSPEDFAGIPEIREWPVEKALIAETENQLSGEDKWRIRSFITLTDESGGSRCMSSDDFSFNPECDDIVEIGSYGAPKFWRSISHRFNRRDMMLGDVAVTKVDTCGCIRIADKSELQGLVGRRGVGLTFAGHPGSSVNGNALDFKSDETRLPLEELPEYPGHYFMITHEGGLTPGFSGGPAIVRDGLSFKAVGVISVVDESDRNRSYSVPVSEIEEIIKKD